MGVAIMRRKITLAVLVVAIIIQLLVPVGMIAYCKKAESDLEKYGTEYKFRIDVDYIYGNTVHFSLEDSWYRWTSADNDYGLIAIDGEGYAYFEDYVDTRPPISSYVRFTDDNKIRLRSFEANIDIDMHRIEDENSYVIIKVFNGDVKVLGVYIDGMSAEEWVEIPPATEENIEDEYLLF